MPARVSRASYRAMTEISVKEVKWTTLYISDLSLLKYDLLRNPDLISLELIFLFHTSDVSLIYNTTTSVD